jgi:hypothetical protein
VVILTDHRVIDYDLVRCSASVVVDTRNAIQGRHPNVFRLGAPPPIDGVTRRRNESVERAAPDAQAVA